MDAAPVIARGHNVAVFVPPVPEAARQLLAGLSRRPALVLTADSDRAAALAEVAGDSAFPATGIARAARRLSTDIPAILCVSTQDALELVRRSALRPGEFKALVIAWPESFGPEESGALDTVMGELDKDAQRLVLSAEPGPSLDRLVERYAFKAMTYGFPAVEPGAPHPPAAPVGPARYVIAHRSRFGEVRTQVLDALAPEADDEVVVAGCPASREEASRLAGESSAAQPPVIVAEPTQLKWLRSLFAPLQALPLPGEEAKLARGAEAIRTRLLDVIERESLERELFLVGPLLERHDPALVAAAALRMAERAPDRQAGHVEAAATTSAPVPSFARIWVGIGRKDNVRPGDLVGALAKEAGLPADAIGRIEVRDLFCLVEIRSDRAEEAARALTGMSVRGRRLTARVDRGPGPGPHRPPRRV